MKDYKGEEREEISDPFPSPSFNLNPDKIDKIFKNSPINLKKEEEEDRHFISLSMIRDFPPP